MEKCKEEKNTLKCWKKRENFIDSLVFGPKDSVIELIDMIKPDHKKCLFLSVSIRGGDLEILQMLLDRSPKKGLKNALSMTALQQNEEAAKMLLRHKKTNIETFRGTTVHQWLKKVEESL